MCNENQTTEQVASETTEQVREAPVMGAEQSNLYKELMLPLLEQLKAICESKGIHMMTAFAFDDGSHEGFHLRGLSGMSDQAPVNMQVAQHLVNSELSETQHAIMGMKIFSGGGGLLGELLAGAGIPSSENEEMASDKLDGAEVLTDPAK